MSCIPEFDLVSHKPGWHFRKSSGGTFFGRLLTIMIVVLAALYLMACILPQDTDFALFFRGDKDEDRNIFSIIRDFGGYTYGLVIISKALSQIVLPNYLDE